jgi:hypothetical protein
VQLYGAMIAALWFCIVFRHFMRRNYSQRTTRIGLR